jgi:uncharacterized protein (TIGR02145 family)
MIKKIFSVFAFMLFAVSMNAQSLNESCTGLMTDRRDNQSYRTVRIGNQCWMAENLNAGIMVTDFQQTDNDIVEKTCYNSDPEMCKIYGGLYTWDEANSGVCPDG